MSQLNTHHCVVFRLELEGNLVIKTRLQTIFNFILTADYAICRTARLSVCPCACLFAVYPSVACTSTRHLLRKQQEAQLLRRHRAMRM